MKKQDLIFILALLVIFLPFVFFKQAYDFLFDPKTGMNTMHPLLVAFFKFFVLATMGEMLGLRIKTGKYHTPGFGIFPRAVVWGILGVMIAAAFIIFDGGTMLFAKKVYKMSDPQAFMSGALGVQKILLAFSISTFLNVFFAPMFMTLHKITDTHILQNGGKFKSIYTPIKFEQIITTMNWKVQWSFVFKKTIPMFWIPAQTINFCFAPQYRVLNAAILSIVLGVILAIANMKKD